MLLERAVTHWLVSPSLLVVLAVLPGKPLLLCSDATVHQVAERGELASGHQLANPVVQATLEPELFLLIGVGVVGGVSHHLHEVALILFHVHGTLDHCAEILGLLDHHLLWHVLVAECLSELLPGDVSGVCVGVAVAVPPGLSGSLQLVCSNGDALLVIAFGEVNLRIDDPEPVVGVHRVLRVAEHRRPQTNESLDLPVQAFLLGGAGCGPLS